jgi:1-deoxyxylulose-5-phosphate synthase
MPIGLATVAGPETRKKRSMSPVEGAEANCEERYGDRPGKHCTAISFLAEFQIVRYVRLGRSGLEVSRVCLGMMSFGSPAWQPWVLPGNEGTGFVQQALDLGINFFDTADFYSNGESENALGEAIGKLTRRDKVVIATKVGLPMEPGPNGMGLSRKHIHSSIDASLRRLKTDYIDLYQLHRADPATPIEETLGILGDLIRVGKVLHVGLSNFAAWQLASAFFIGKFESGVRISSAQIQYNLAFREEERDTLPFCNEFGLGTIVYSPLARGWLTGNRLEQSSLTTREASRAKGDAKAHALYGNDADRRVLDCLRAMATERGVPMGRMALGWLHSRDAVSSILCGALEPAHLNEAVAAVDFELSDEEIVRLEGCYVPQSLKDDGLQVVVDQQRKRRASA